MGEVRTWRLLGTTAFCLAAALTYQTTCDKSLLFPAFPNPGHYSRAVCVRCSAGSWASRPLGPSGLIGTKTSCATYKDRCSHEFTGSENSSAGGFSEEEGTTQSRHPTPSHSPPLCQATVAPPVLTKPNLKTMKICFLPARKVEASKHPLWPVHLAFKRLFPGRWEDLAVLRMVILLPVALLSQAMEPDQAVLTEG